MKVLIWGGEARYRADLPHAVQSLPLELVFCPREALTPEMDAFFTTRHCWFDSREPWFRDGQRCCPWADYYPQNYGWDEDPNVAEMMSVAPGIAYRGSAEAFTTAANR